MKTGLMATCLHHSSSLLGLPSQLLQVGFLLLQVGCLLCFVSHHLGLVLFHGRCLRWLDICLLAFTHWIIIPNGRAVGQAGKRV